MKGSQKDTLRRYGRIFVIGVMVDVLAFNPTVYGQQQAVAWNGGISVFSDSASWSTGFSPNNGLSNSTYLATIASGNTDAVTFDVSNVVLDGLVLGYNGVSAPAVPPATARLDVGNMNGVLTLGTIGGQANNNVLAVYNGGTLNVNNGASVTLELSAAGAGALNEAGGQINVTDGGTLTLQNTATGSSTLTNNGTIGATGSEVPAVVRLNDGGTGSTFTLSGNGSLTLGGTGAITGQNFTESLINDTSHTIAGDGVISSLANFTNNGTLHASTSGASLNLLANLTNVSNDPMTGGLVLAGGTYTVDNGASLVLSSLGSPLTFQRNVLGTGISLAGSLQTLAGANLSITGSGLLSGDGTTDALAGISNITDSNLTLTNVGSSGSPYALTGGNLTLSTTAAGSGASLTLDNSTVTVGGTFTNSANTDTTSNTSLLQLQNGANLTTGAMLNQANVSLNLNNANANVVVDGSALNVDSLSTYTNNGFAYSNITVQNGGTLVVNHDFLQGGDASGVTSWGNDSLTIDGVGSSVTVHGQFQNNNELNGNSITVQNGGSITVDGGNLSNLAVTNSGGISTTNTLDFTNATLNLGGFNLNNTATDSATSTGAFPQAIVNFNGGNTIQKVGAINNTFNDQTAGDLGSGGSGGYAAVTITGGDSMTVGSVRNILNDSSATGGFGQAALNIGDFDSGGTGSLTVTGNLRNEVNDSGYGSVGSASVDVLNGSQLTVNGNLINKYDDTSANGAQYSGENGANIYATGSNITVGGNLNNFLVDNSGGSSNGLATITLVGASTLEVQNGVLNNYVTDNTQGQDLASSGIAGIAVLEESQLKADGGLSNVVNDNSVFGGIAQAGIAVDGSSLVVGTQPSQPNAPALFSSTNILTNGVNDQSQFGSAGLASIVLTNNSNLTVWGNVSNYMNSSYQYGLAVIALDQSSGVIHGDLNNGTAPTLVTTQKSKIQGGDLTCFCGFFGSVINLADQSTLTVDGNVNNNGFIILGNDQFVGEQVLPPGTASQFLFGTGGGGNTLAVGGTLMNMGSIDSFGINNSIVSSTSNALSFTNGGVVTVHDSSSLSVGSSIGASAAIENTSTGTIIVGDNSTGEQASLVVNGSLTNDAGGQIGINGTGYMNVTQSFVNNGQTTLQQNGAALYIGIQQQNAPALRGLGTAQTFIATNTGTMTQTDGSITTVTVAGNLKNTDGGSYYIGSGGTTHVTGNVVNDGASIDGQSSITVNGGQLNVDGDLSNDAALNTTTGSGIVNVTGSIFNTSNGVVNMSGDGDSVTAGVQFQNSGMVTVGAGETLTAGSDGYLQTAGSTDVSGTVVGDVTIDGGVLSGGGTIIGNLTVDDGGTLAPGDPQSIEIIGDFTLGMMGILDLDVAGLGDPSQYDHVNATGNVTLNGTIEINPIDGFVPMAGETLYDVVEWGADGQLTTPLGSFVQDGLLFTEQIDANNANGLDLVISTLSTATPEPGTLGMMFGALLVGAGVTWRARRRKSA